MNSVLPPAPAAIPPNVPAHLVVDFDVYSPTADADRFHQAFVDFQRATPHRVVWSTRHGGHWIAVRGEDVYELHADHARFSSRQYFVPAAPEQGPMGAFTLDPPEHQPFRAFLNAGLSPRIVAEKNILLKRLAADLANQIAPRRGCEFIESFADVLPLTTFLDLVDLPLADQHHLRHLANAATRAPDPAHRVESLMGLAAYLQPHLAARRGKPGDDLLSRVANADISGRPIAEDESLGASIHILGAGFDTSSSLFSFVMLFLARNPEHRRTLAKDPARIPAATQELLRRFPPVTMVRRVREDLDYGGVTLRKGQMIAIPGALYNLDEAIYQRPLEVDFDRQVDRTLTFGHGPHRCPGAMLGKNELALGLEAWLQRIPDFEVPQDAVIPVSGGTVAKILRLPLSW